MKRIAAPILALAFAATAVAAPRPELSALMRIASKLSGLPVEKSVTVKVVPRSAFERRARKLLDRDYPPERQAYDQAVYRALGLLPPGGSLRPALLRHHVKALDGLYDPRRRIAYVRAGPSRRDATLRALLHALEDQAFDLRRLAGLRRDSRDAGLAAAAAVDGTVAYAQLGTSIRLGTSPAAPVHAFVELEREFRQATGARLAATLDHLGGRRAVWSAVRRFPATTEQVFHVDAFLGRERTLPILLPESAAGFTLAGRDSWGELDVRALLAVFQVPRVDVVGAGWGGGASAVYRGPAGEAVALALAWDSEADAAQWAEAVETYVNQAFDAETPGRPPTSPCAAAACWRLADRSVAFVQAGPRTALVVAPSVEAAAALGAAFV